MGIILKPGEEWRTKKSLRLQTLKGSDIDNYQVFELSHFERNQFTTYVTKFPNVVYRSAPSPIYNCHGMTFTCKRTNIDNSEELKKILVEDLYVELQLLNILPGDIVLYINPDNNDIIHSGIVIECVHEYNNLSFIKVISKWGKYKEAIHLLNDCPYPDTIKKFYRVNHDYE